MTLNKDNYSNQNDDLTDHKQQSVLPEIKGMTLLEEKLQVTRSKQKVGELIIRKKVETSMIQVPVQREKLIVERIGKNPKKLAEVVIKEEKVNGFTHEELENTDSLHITTSTYLKPQIAQELLQSVADLSSAKNTKIRLEIISTCSKHQIEQQDVCDRYL